MKNLLKFQGRIGLNAAYVLIACAVFLFAVFAPLVAEADNPPLFANKYTRTIGKPNVFSEKFKSCNTGATYKMIVENGGTLGLGRVSSASITLNGSEVVKESDFNQKVDKIERNVTLVEANTLEVKLASGTGGTLNISIFCAANCLEVKITEPKSGDSRIPSFLLRGELYNAQGLIDIKVDNGVGRAKRVYKSGNKFGGMMSMPSSSASPTGYVSETTFTAIAMDACGYKAMDSVLVKYVEDPTNSQPGHLPANPEFAVISKKTGVARAELGRAMIEGVEYYEWDFEGDGVVDTSGTGLVGLYHEYTQPGFYTPTRIDPLPDGPGMGVVVVITEDELDSQVKPVWNGLKNALANSDVEGALVFIAPRSKDKYRKLYGRMKSIGTMPKAAADMGEPKFDEAYDDTAYYLITKKQRFKGKDEDITFEIRFERNRDTGLWEIEGY